jgi:hypothetical protein
VAKSSVDTSAERGAGLLGVDKASVVRLNPDEQFFVEHKDELLRAYEGRFVAIRHGEVAADAATHRELEETLSRKYGEPVYAMVRRVTKGSFEFRAEEPIFIS